MMSEAISIQQATAKDIGALIILYDEFHAFHVRGVPDRLRFPAQTSDEDAAEVGQSLSDLLKREDAAIFLVRVGETVAGLAEVYIKQDEEHPLTIARRFGYLQSLIVLESFRKHGLGKLLVEAAKQWAKERGATEMQLDTWEFDAGPLHFYEHLGYRTLRRHMVAEIE
ncbi:MAG TPA: GNAT family N-acetyltransferase [Ktedonobacteraceae bacterium]